MKLFQRVESVIQRKKLTKKSVAKELGIPHNTFGRYFCPEHQDKLAALLWRLSALWPDVSRDWLFFGDENVPELPKEPVTLEELQNLRDKVSSLQAALDDERQLTRKLTLKLLDSSSKV